MRRWNPWNAVIVVVLMCAAFALERFLGVDPAEALMDAIFIGFIRFAILEYWRD